MSSSAPYVPGPRQGVRVLQSKCCLIFLQLGGHCGVWMTPYTPRIVQSLPSFACLLLSFVCLFCLQCVLPIPMFLLHVLSCRALSFVSLSLVPVWSALSSLAMALCFIYLVAISLSFSFTPAFRDSPLGHMLHASLSFSCAHPTCSLFKFSLSVHFSFLSAASILSEFLFTFLPCLSWATFSVFFCICVSLLLVDFLSQHHSVALCLLVFLSSTFLLSVHFEHFISLQVCVSLVF